MADPSSQFANHLANERTFLAWLRTAIAMISFGLVIVRLRYLVPQTGGATQNAPREYSHGALHIGQLGLMFSIIGLLMVGFALFNFLATRRALEREDYHERSTAVVIFSGAVLLLGVAVVIYLVGLASPLPPAAAP